MYHHLLGRLPLDTINFFKTEIVKRRLTANPYEWIMFDDFLNLEFLKIFENTELKVQWNNSLKIPRPVQKAFYSAPGHGFRIHKDGTHCKSALNIAISCNDNDWVRWYDEDFINNLKQDTEYSVNTHGGTSRDLNIKEYENIPCIKEVHNKIGDVYVVDTDTWHSFKCNGPEPRIVIQTKFEGFPNLDTIKESLIKKSFSNLIPINET